MHKVLGLILIPEKQSAKSFIIIPTSKKRIKRGPQNLLMFSGLQKIRND
jgi:hypothetical protein